MTMNILLPTAEELATALNKAEFAESFNRAVATAGGAGNFEGCQHMTLAELADLLALNGVRFRNPGLPFKPDSACVVEWLKTTEQVSPYLKPLP